MFKLFIALTLSFVVFVNGASIVARADGRSNICEDGAKGKIIHSEVYKGHLYQVLECKNTDATLARFKENHPAKGGPGITWTPASKSELERAVEKRAWNLCGAPCTTYCDTPAGGGPDPNHCSAMAAIQAPQGTFRTQPGVHLILTYASCRVDFTNLGSDELVYCWGDWAGVVNYIAWNCQAPQNAHGGSCHYYNAWTIAGLGLSA